MKTNELRLGNLVMCNNQIVKVTGLHSDIFECHSLDDKSWMWNIKIKNAHPIELTEEVLVKVGFEKNKYDWWEHFPDRENEISILMTDNYTTIEYANLFHCPEDVTEVNYNSRLEFPRRIYIHELQNAYYCLTGQELNIEL